MLDLGFIDFGDTPSDPALTERKAPVIIDVEQNTPEWYAVRAGKVTASRISDVIANSKEKKMREKYLNELAIERLTGKPIRGGFENSKTRHGKNFEAEAIELYEFRHAVDAIRVGFVLHPTLPDCGCSPDALIDDKGMVQIKAPDQYTHFKYWMDRKVPRDYFMQMQWEMACTDREWNDFVSYDPDQIVTMQLLVVRVERDDKIIADLESAVSAFCDDLNELLEKIKNDRH